MIRQLAAAAMVLSTAVVSLAVQNQGGQGRGGPGGVPAGRPPTHANIEYAPAYPSTSKGHLLDLYLPPNVTKPVPVVIWTGGSAWRAGCSAARKSRASAEGAASVFGKERA